MIQLCIFDLDGTLADTLASIAYSANQALEALGLKSHPIEDYKNFAGDGIYELMKRSIRASGAEEGQYFEKMLGLYRGYFKENAMYEVKPFPGILELLEKLKETGIKIAVLSNKPHLQTVQVTESLFGEDYFDMVLGQQDGIKRKPDPEGVNKILEELGVLEENCFYIGDTDTDMQTGNRAGIITIGVLWGFRGYEELKANHAAHIVERPEEILEIVGAEKNYD